MKPICHREWHVDGVAAMKDLESSTLNSSNRLPQIFPSPTVRPVEMPIQIPSQIATPECRPDRRSYLELSRLWT
ncbi:hypothetical protein FQN53_008414 [Emmonsiellopsis sp. PD_33]|nr:hypothetical protein FQN53_008414 [Emmonsiellopsis sp. PD_33]